MKKRETNHSRNVVFAAAVAISLALGWVVVPGLEAYRQDQHPLPPAWSGLQVVYLLPPAGIQLNAKSDPINYASHLNLQAVFTIQEVTKHADQKGLDVFIFHASSLGDIDRNWAIQQNTRGTAFVGLDVKPVDLGTLVGSGQFADWSTNELQEPFLSAILEKRVHIPNAWTWFFSTPLRLPRPRDRIGNEAVIGPRVYLYAPIGRDVAGDLEPIRVEMDRFHLVRP